MTCLGSNLHHLNLKVLILPASSSCNLDFEILERHTTFMLEKPFSIEYWKQIEELPRDRKNISILQLTFSAL